MKILSIVSLPNASLSSIKAMAVVLEKECLINIAPRTCGWSNRPMRIRVRELRFLIIVKKFRASWQLKLGFPFG